MSASPTRRRYASSAAWLVAGALFVLGCSSIGPRTVMRDRFDFGTAVAESWKQQTLLAIVKLRYLDVPVFLDVGQIVSGYTLETGVDLSGQVAPVTRTGDTFGAFGGRSVFTDRPTITYTPLTGDKFLRGLMSPIPTASILYTLQTGYAADFVLAWTLESLNGLHNRSAMLGPARTADPAFVRALALMRELQTAGGVALGVEKSPTTGETAVAVFRRAELPPEVEAKSIEVRRLLGLPVALRQFPVVTSSSPAPQGALAMQPRSLLQVLQAVAAFVEVPPEHLAKEWVTAVAETDEAEHQIFGIRIRSSRHQPPQPYAAVRYKGHWFWIDQSDWRTKRTLVLVILLFTLTDTGTPERLPVLTIPTN